jgi:hypothetical protein
MSQCPNCRKVVRLHNSQPTPYLRKHWKALLPKVPDKSKCIAVDIGSGNGRNTLFLAEQGIGKIFPLDMNITQTGMLVNNIPLLLGHDSFPVEPNSVHIYLANYVFMFLDKNERIQVISEIQRTATPNACIMVELHPAKQSLIATEAEISLLQHELQTQLGWSKVMTGKGRFIARKGMKL